MQIKFLKRIVEHVAGPSAVDIVDLLAGSKDVNEFIIAKKLKLSINQTRNLLYRLSHLGILSSIRKKDKRKGWYIYFWTLNHLKSLEILEENLQQELSRLYEELKKKKSERFYKCKLCGRELNEETALLSNFICLECGEVYELADHKRYIVDTEKNIAKLKKELEPIRLEKEEELKKQAQKLGRKIKKVEKDKSEKRMKAMAKRKRDKKRFAKKEAKNALERKNRMDRNKKSKGKKSANKHLKKIKKKR